MLSRGKGLEQAHSNRKIKLVNWHDIGTLHIKGSPSTPAAAVWDVMMLPLLGDNTMLGDEALSVGQDVRS